MEIAKVSVSGVAATTVEATTIPAGIIGATIAVEYGPEWGNMIKNVSFRGAEDVTVVNVGNVVKLPQEVAAKPNMYIQIGFTGVSGDGTVLIPTLWAYLGTTKPASPVNVEGGSTPPVWAQVAAMIGDLNQLNTPSQDNLVNAINDAAKSGNNNVDLSGYVKSVNGVKPDADGNVEVKVSSDSGQNPSEGGMTTAQINALDAMLNLCSFAKEDVSAEYTAFREAFGLKVLSSISATYSGGNVTVGTAVSALTGIVVTAHYSDGTSEPVTGYTMSGTIAEGSNTITVGYGGMTTTFAVIGVYEAGTFTITNTLTNVTTSNTAQTITEGEAYTATLTAKDGYELTIVTVTMDSEDITATAYSGGVVNITSVTGNVVITASAAEKAAEIYEPAAPVSVSVTLDISNTLLDHGTGATSTNASWITSDFVELPSGGDYIVISRAVNAAVRFALYDSDKNYISGSALGGVMVNTLELTTQDAAYIRVSSNVKTIGDVTVAIGNNMVTSWGTTTDNHINTDGTITEGYTGAVQQKISNGYVKIPNGVTTLTRFNRSGYSFRYIDFVLYDENFAFVAYNRGDSPATNGITFDLTELSNAAYFKIGAWDAGDTTNDNPAEQIIVACY